MADAKLAMFANTCKMQLSHKLPPTLIAKPHYNWKYMNIMRDKRNKSYWSIEPWMSGGFLGPVELQQTFIPCARHNLTL